MTTTTRRACDPVRQKHDADVVREDEAAEQSEGAQRVEHVEQREVDAETREEPQTAADKEQKQTQEEAGNDSEAGYEVEKVIGQRALKDGTIEYNLLWKGYGREHDSWQPRRNIDPDYVSDYLKANNFFVRLQLGRRDVFLL